MQASRRSVARLVDFWNFQNEHEIDCDSPSKRNRVAKRNDFIVRGSTFQDIKRRFGSAPRRGQNIVASIQSSTEIVNKVDNFASESSITLHNKTEKFVPVLPQKNSAPTSEKQVTEATPTRFQDLLWEGVVAPFGGFGFPGMVKVSASDLIVLASPPCKRRRFQDELREYMVFSLKSTTQCAPKKDGKDEGIVSEIINKYENNQFQDSELSTEHAASRNKITESENPPSANFATCSIGSKDAVSIENLTMSSNGGKQGTMPSTADIVADEKLPKEGDLSKANDEEMSKISVAAGFSTENLMASSAVEDGVDVAEEILSQQTDPLKANGEEIGKIIATADIPINTKVPELFENLMASEATQITMADIVAEKELPLDKNNPLKADKEATSTDISANTDQPTKQTSDESNASSPSQQLSTKSSSMAEFKEESNDENLIPHKSDIVEKFDKVDANEYMEQKVKIVTSTDFILNSAPVKCDKLSSFTTPVDMAITSSGDIINPADLSVKLNADNMAPEVKENLTTDDVIVHCKTDHANDEIIYDAEESTKKKSSRSGPKRFLRFVLYPVRKLRKLFRRKKSE